MRSQRRSSVLQILLGGVVVLVALAVVILGRGSSSARSPARTIASMFQDDDHLIYASTQTVTTTLDALRGLGVDQVRATVLWSAIAPDPASRVPPRPSGTSNPADYPARLWAPYDRLVELARARGIAVDFNVTAPGPLWAMGGGAPSTRYADHWMPSAAAFARFVLALGTRYSGRYVPAGRTSPLPRVSFWSIWNEPNQPGWLAPQWRSAAGREVMEAPVLYRRYVDAAFAALARSGHRPSTDTILVGELAPEGCVAAVPCIYPRQHWPIPPLPFLRALYCLGPDYTPLRRGSAAQLGCPRTGDPRTFVARHPGLFESSGLAHHPYSFFLAPDVPMANSQFAPLANLARLERSLDSIFRTYGVHRRLPLYLTEYGYETDPPNPYRGVSPAIQSLYLNEAQYMAWRDPRVLTLSQFLLYDARPNPRYPPGSPGYWSTFQTGLRYADGRPKPSLAAYRLPLFIPDPVLGSDNRILVWAMLRTAPGQGEQRAELQWRPRPMGSNYRTLQRLVTSNPSGVVTAVVTVPGPGVVRIEWRSPDGRVQHSRQVSVRLR